MVKAKVLDVCCGSKMFYYDKNNPNVIFMDNRCLETVLCDGRKLVIKPDVIGDFTNLGFESESFRVVVFDPPHLLHAGKESWLANKYGVLPKDWKPYLQAGFRECFRVLKLDGVLIFKWSNEQIQFSDVIKLAPQRPLLGDKRSKTRWVIFVKEREE